jgi:hypothetical protein
MASCSAKALNGGGGGASLDINCAFGLKSTRTFWEVDTSRRGRIQGGEGIRG